MRGRAAERKVKQVPWPCPSCFSQTFGEFDEILFSRCRSIGPLGSERRVRRRCRDSSAQNRSTRERTQGTEGAHRRSRPRVRASASANSRSRVHGRRRRRAQHFGHGGSAHQLPAAFFRHWNSGTENGQYGVPDSIRLSRHLTERSSEKPDRPESGQESKHCARGIGITAAWWVQHELAAEKFHSRSLSCRKPSHLTPPERQSGTARADRNK